MDIEAVIAQATEVAPESKATEVAETAETPQEPVVNEEADKAEAEGPKPDSELTPEQLAKREANRQSHLNSKLAKMRRENRELKELAAKLQAQPTSTPATNGEPTPPDPSKFDDWDKLQEAERKYTRDLARWEARQEFSEREAKSTEQAEISKVDSQKAERIHSHASKEAEFAKQNPDYEQTVYGEYGDFMQNLPLSVAEALIEADNASLALYALAKEGTLESLEDLSPYRISMEIAKAEIRGEKYLNQNKTTNAPEPVERAKGTGNPSKSLANQSVEELMKRFNTR